jgi:GTP cyclohydrolase IA
MDHNGHQSHNGGLVKNHRRSVLRDVDTATLRQAPDSKEKIERIASLFEEIMLTLGMDLTDDSLIDTPQRVAKMYVNEMFRGLDEANKPQLTTFENTYGYNGILVEKDITIHSYCEHHFVPFVGRAHVAYIPNQRVIGLSKLNRIVQYYAARPQVQERLTVQIMDELKKVLETDDVAVMIEAEHMCLSMRGAKDQNSRTVTALYSGRFTEEKMKKEFSDAIK